MGKSKARKGTGEKLPSYAVWSNPDRVEWDRLRRRSGAAGGHKGPKDRPRSTQRSEAIAASGRCSFLGRHRRRDETRAAGRRCPPIPDPEAFE